MQANKFFLMTAALALALAGCGGQDTQPVDTNAEPTDQPFVPTSTTANNDSAPAGRILPWEGSTPAQVELVNNNLVVYFEFDRSEIRPEFNDMLAAHASYLGSNAGSTVTIRLEGHSDERGSREYNIGLGERRALAVRQILLLQGATASQVTTVSYGEERPAALGSDDESYGLNRRVELVYR